MSGSVRSQPSSPIHLSSEKRSVLGRHALQYPEKSCSQDTFTLAPPSRRGSGCKPPPLPTQSKRRSHGGGYPDAGAPRGPQQATLTWQHLITISIAREVGEPAHRPMTHHNVLLLAARIFMCDGTTLAKRHTAGPAACSPRRAPARPPAFQSRSASRPSPSAERSPNRCTPAAPRLRVLDPAPFKIRAWAPSITPSNVGSLDPLRRWHTPTLTVSQGQIAGRSGTSSGDSGSGPENQAFRHL
jgi:hypothetical protein